MGRRLALLAVLALFPAAVQADSMAQERARLADATARAAAARLQSDALRQRAADARAAADQVAARRAELANAIAGAEAETEADQARLALLAVQQRQQAQRLMEQRRPLVELTAALQSLARRPTILMLAQPALLNDMIHVRAILASVEPEIVRRTAMLRADMARAATLRQQTVVALSALDASRKALAQRRAQLAGLEAGHLIQAGQLSASALDASERAMGLADRADELNARLGSLARTGDSAAALTAIAPPDAPLTAFTTPAVRPPAYRLPLSAPVESGLGETTDYGYRTRGITLRAPAGATVVAPAAGRVTYAGRFRDYGVIVIIAHGDGWTSLVTGLGAASVTVGEDVAAGAVIGHVGPAPADMIVELRRGERPIDIGAMAG